MTTDEKTTIRPDAAPATHHHIVRACPNCSRHTLVLKDQWLVCRSCAYTVWRSES
jgi:ribosomal protein S27AE